MVIHRDCGQQLHLWIVSVPCDALATLDTRIVSDKRYRLRLQDKAPWPAHVVIPKAQSKILNV